MGVLKDVVDVIKSSEAIDEFKDNASKKKYSSIANRALEGTMQFPIIVSSSMDIDTLQMIVKALERNYATFVQTVLSMNSIVDTSKTNDIADYLKQFHQNYQPTNMSATNAINAVVKFTDEGYDFTVSKDMLIASETYSNTSSMGLDMDNKSQLTDPMSGIKTEILNNKYKPIDSTIYNFKDSKKTAKYNSVVSEALDEEEIDLAQRKANLFAGNEERRRAAAGRFAENREARDAERHNPSMNRDIAATNKDLYSVRTRELPSQMLKDNDVKKANELIATTMHTRLFYVGKDGQPQGTRDFILGIKGTMHPIKSDEMVNNIVAACQNTDTAFNFFRWTTGEISFFKDFWLNISEMKRLVANESKGASKWWVALKNRRALGKISGTMFFKNNLLPNATIVISAEEAEYIKTKFGYNVMDSYFVQKIMNQYYLLGFVVVDTSAQIAHFMFDGYDGGFQSVSFSGLEKENTRDERKFKEMLKVINRN